VGHAAVDNKTPFVVETLFLADEEMRPLAVPLAMLAFSIGPTGRLKLAEKPPAIPLGGEYYGDPAETSPKYEPQSAFVKPATDVVLIGHAYAPEPGTTTVDVAVRVGAVEKAVRVTGDRTWVKSFGLIRATDPEPFEKIPLRWERAFGGWDRSGPDESRHAFEPRNSVGVGFRSGRGSFEDGLPLPNIEDLGEPLTRFTGRPKPAGLGFTLPHWQPRASFAGTYDAKWDAERKPMLPEDFDIRFFNAAAPGMVAPGLLSGDEEVLVRNATPGGTLSFRLPGGPPPRVRLQLVGRKDHRPEMRLDTVIVNTDDQLLLMLWRGHVALRNGPHDLVTVEVRSDAVEAALKRAV